MTAADVRTEHPVLPPGFRLVEGIPDDRYPEWLDHWLGIFGNPVSSDPDMVQFYRGTHPAERGYAIDTDDGFVATNMCLDRELTVPGGRTVPAAAGTGGSSHPTVARRGLMRLTADLMTRRAVDEGKAVMAGGASEWPIYGRFGSGPTSWCESVEVDVLGAGLRDEVPGADLRPRRVAGAEARDLARTLFHRHALQTPGEVVPPPCYWERLAGNPVSWQLESALAMTPPGAGARFNVAVEDRGLVTYRIIPNWTAEMAPQSTLHVVDLLAADQEAEGALWRHLFAVDLVATVQAWRLPVDSPLRWWVRDGRRIRSRRQDALWLRPLDICQLLSARAWACPGTLTLTIHDRLGYAAGTYRLVVDGVDGVCERTTAEADLEMDVDSMGAILLGGTSAISLARSGRIRAADPRKAHLWDTMATPDRAPHISYWF